MRRTRLAAIVVNHRSGAFARRCVESLAAAWRGEGRAARDLAIVVVDCASGAAERPHLEALAAAGCEVVALAENVGYAGGLCVGWERVRARGHDQLALLNPDLVFLPGSIGPLVEHLATHPDCGLVGPRAYVDEARALLHPPLELPGESSELESCLAPHLPGLARARLVRRLEEELRVWGATEPVDVPMLSGACLVLRAETVREFGGPMDPGYPLYYEDADLARRVAAAGLSLTLVPRAEILHHWSRSAGGGAAFAGEPMRRFRLSRARYLERHAGPGALRRLAALERSARDASLHSPHPFTDLGPLEEPPGLALPRPARWVAELSLSPAFVLAGGMLGEGRSLRLPSAAWRWLFPGGYWLRVLDRDDRTLLGAFRFEKRTAARAFPLDLRREAPAPSLLRCARGGIA